jgi:hypothetical protein
MRVRILTGVAAVLLLVSSLAAVGAKPGATAHGQFQTELFFAGQWLDVQVAFNVQDRGEEDDHGSLSMRLFDHWTGELIGVVVSPEIWNVDLTPDGGVYFVASLRLAKGSATIPATGQFWVKDGGDADEFRMGPFVLPILKGGIAVRVP